MKDKVQCQICKKWFKQITETHLQNKHGITFEKYKEMFPDVETHPQALRDKLVNANVEKWSDPEYKDRVSKTISDINKVVMNDPEMTKKLEAGSARRWSREDERDRQRQILLDLWDDPLFREMQSEKTKKQWENEDFRNAVINAGKKQTGKNNPFYKPEIDIWIEENINKHLCQCGCGRYIIIKREQYHNGIPKYYSMECYNKNISGENNPMFGKSHRDESIQLMSEKAIKLWTNLERRILASCKKLGISREEWVGFTKSEHEKIRYSWEYKDWHTSTFKRDDYTCQICGKRGGELNGHHIYKVSKYPELIFEINNGITLCYDCHFIRLMDMKKNMKLNYYQKYLIIKG